MYDSSKFVYHTGTRAIIIPVKKFIANSYDELLDDIHEWTYYSDMYKWVKDRAVSSITWENDSQYDGLSYATAFAMLREQDANFFILKWS